MKTNWRLLALIGLIAVGPGPAGADHSFPSGGTSTSADPGGTAEARIDQTTGKLFVKASVTQDPIPKPQALIADHRSAIAEAALVWRYAPLLEKNVRYFAEVSIEFPSTGPEATFAEDEALEVPTGARGAAALIGVEFEARAINCYGATCSVGDAPGSNGLLACSDPEAATTGYWGSSPWDCQRPTEMTMKHSLPVMAHATADYSYLEVEVGLRAIAFLRDWRGRHASAGSGATIVEISVRAVPTQQDQVAAADSSDGIESAPPADSSSPASTTARPAKSMPRARERQAAQRLSGDLPGASGASDTRAWTIAFGMPTALATGMTIRWVMRSRRRQRANLT